MSKVLLFKRFERFWHWTQAFLMLGLLITGFEVHGSYHLLGFEQAVNLHRIGAWSLVTLWIFAIFWHITTGEWRQYIPTLENVTTMIRYYLLGIFTDAPHPFRATPARKHNPLQRLAYLFLWLVISPLIWFSGWLYLFYSSWESWGLVQHLELQNIAFLHVVGAFMMLTFVIVHVYLITTGKTVFTHMRAMVTGWEELDSDP